MGTVPACIYVFHVCTWCSQRLEKGVRSLGTGITGSCERPCGSWEGNQDAVQEQHVPLTSEPPVQEVLITFGERFRFSLFYLAPQFSTISNFILQRVPANDSLSIFTLLNCKISMMLLSSQGWRIHDIHELMADFTQIYFLLSLTPPLSHAPSHSLLEDDFWAAAQGKKIIH